MFPAMLRVVFIGIGNKDILIRVTGLMFLRRGTLQMKFNTNNKTKTTNQNGNNKPVIRTNRNPWNHSIKLHKMVA
jgi:hypothetical protein